MVAAVAAGLAIKEIESRGTNCEESKVEGTVKAVEDKFATYWPRNILILFGPPVSIIMFSMHFCCDGLY